MISICNIPTTYNRYKDAYLKRQCIKYNQDLINQMKEFLLGTWSVLFKCTEECMDVCILDDHHPFKPMSDLINEFIFSFIEIYEQIPKKTDNMEDVIAFKEELDHMIEVGMHENLSNPSQYIEDLCGYYFASNQPLFIDTMDNCDIFYTG